jgi:hypothetical protein
MFSREQSSQIKEEFWTAFGKYMSPVPSAEGLKINWINYHTRLKHIYFRMDAGNKSATISISIEHPDPDVRELYFDQFTEFKNLLHATVGEEWIWQMHAQTGGREISRIFKEISDVSILNKNHWPILISFFKPRIIALDSFWEDAKYVFQEFK